MCRCTAANAFIAHPLCRHKGCGAHVGKSGNTLPKHNPAACPVRAGSALLRHVEIGQQRDSIDVLHRELRRLIDVPTVMRRTPAA
jgi:hypothetical protein